MTDIVEELFDSDAASVLTNRAAREIIRLRSELEAAQSQAATTKNVHVVPPECDRIVWRGSYYHLSNIPDLAAAQAREAQLREALDEVDAFSSHAELYRAVQKALALPTDDTALRARLKAERERCAKFVQEHAAFIDEDGDRITSAGNAILADAIRNLGDE